jgi:hypothetical protein
MQAESLPRVSQFVDIAALALPDLPYFAPVL